MRKPKQLERPAAPQPLDPQQTKAVTGGIAVPIVKPTTGGSG